MVPKFFLADLKQRIVLSHEFGVVRLYRTFSIYIVTGETRCAGCYICTGSGWFKHSAPPRTFSNHISTEVTRFVHWGSSSASYLLEPSRTTSLQLL